MAATEIFPGIVSDPETMGGRPIIKGHRITVAQLIGHLAAGDTVEEIRDSFELTDAEMQAVLDFAAETVKDRELTYVVKP
jgi:uncharacterized protein (DUF433 family)